MTRRYLRYFIIIIILLNCKSNEINVKKFTNYNDIYYNYNIKNYDTTLNLINQIENQDPDLLNLAGNICLKMNNIFDAELYFKRAYNMNKNEKNGLSYSNLLIIKNDLKGALLIIEDLYKQNKEEPLFSYLIGTISKDFSDFDKALEFFSYSLNKNFQPKNEIYRNIIDIYNSNLDNKTKNKYQLFYLKSIELINYEVTSKEINASKVEYLIKHKKYYEAIEIIKILLNDDPDNEKLNIIYGDLYYLINDYNNSYLTYNNYLEINPSSYDSYLGIINSLIKLKDLSSAIKIIKKIKNIFPNNSEIFFKSCSIYEALFDYKNAISECKLSISFNPNTTNEKFFKIGDLYLLLNEPKEALKYYSKIDYKINKTLLQERISNAYSMIEIEQSKRFLKSGNLDEAIYHARQSIEKSKNLRSEFYYGKLIFLFDNNKLGYNLLMNVFNKYEYYPVIILINELKLLNNTNETEKLDLKKLFEIADFYEDEENFDKAIEYYKISLKREDLLSTRIKISSCYYKIAYDLYHKKLYENALDNLYNSKKYYTDNNYLILENKIKYMIKLENKKLDYINAQEYEKKGKIDEAIKIYLNLFESTNNLEIAEKIIKIYQRNNNIQEIFNFIENKKIITLPTGKEYLANLYFQLGFIEESLNICNALLDQSDKSIIPYLILGMIYLESDPSESLKLYKSALDLYPGSSQALIGIGNAYYKLNDLENAKKFYISSINYRKFDISVYNLLNIYLKEKKIKEIKLLLDIYKEGFKNLDYLYIKAYYYYLIGDYESATLISQELIKKNPKLEYHELYLIICKKNNEPLSTIQNIKAQIGKIKLAENKIIYPKVSNLFIYDVKENLIQPPLKINNNYILLTEKFIYSMNNNLSKIKWKIDGNFKSINNYSNTSFLALSEKELYLIDVTSGILKWKFNFEFENPRIFIRNNIYLIHEKNNKSSNILYKIDENGMLIFNKILNSSMKYFIDNSEYLYSLKSNNYSIEWNVEDMNTEKDLKISTIFTPNNYQIIDIFNSSKFIIFLKGNFLYKFFNDGQLQIKKLKYINYNIITNGNIILSNNNKYYCELDPIEFTCQDIKIENIQNNQIYYNNSLLHIEGDYLKVFKKEDKNSFKEFRINKLMKNAIIKLYIP
jgi:tetratricopeptide (TPR) repeat protein